MLGAVEETVVAVVLGAVEETVVAVVLGAVDETVVAVVLGAVVETVVAVVLGAVAETVMAVVLGAVEETVVLVAAAVTILKITVEKTHRVLTVVECFTLQRFILPAPPRTPPKGSESRAAFILLLLYITVLFMM